MPLLPLERAGLSIYVVPPLLGFIVFIILALLSLFRGRRSSACFLFAGFCICGALINLDVALVSLISDKALAIRIDRIVYVFFVFSIPIYIAFVHSFLGIVRPRVSGTACMASVIFMLISQSDLFLVGYHEYAFGTIAAAGPLYHVFCVCGFAAASYCIWMLFTAYQRAESNLERNRIRYILFGMGLSTFLLIFNVLPMNGWAVYPMGSFGFIPAIILAFGVLKYDLFDMDAMIRKGVTGFILTGSITILYVLLFYVFNVFYLGSVTLDHLVFPFLLALLMVFLYDPVRAEIRDFVDRHFFRGRSDYRRTLAEISGKLTSLIQYGDIADFLLASVPEALQVKNAGLIIREGDEGDYHSYGIMGREDEMMRVSDFLAGFFVRERSPLSRCHEKMNRLGCEGEKEAEALFDHFDAVILFPIVSKGTLRGIVALGEKLSGELFVEEDIELLGTIANQCAIALENAKIYEEIERLNRDLEKRVRVRTAELIRAIEEKEQARDQLIRSESLAAIGQLVAGAAHEINNPVASASSLVQTSVETLKKMQDMRGWPEEVRVVLEDLEFTLTELKRVSDIVGSLLGLSRQTETYVESVSIDHVVENALKILENQYKHHPVSIRRIVRHDLPAVKGSFAQLGQCFVNIIKNAVEALPDRKGDVIITTGKSERGEGVFFECRDNGIGIRKDNLKDIFKPFFTTKAPGKGTGLGLYISHEIIERHGGRIDVFSDGLCGTVVRVELPVLSEPE